MRGAATFRRATIFEVLRVRTVIDVDWPPGQGAELRPRRLADSAAIARCSCALPIFTRIRKSSLTPNDSIRIASAAPRPAAPAWLAFGGGARRCIGADFAIAEMDIVLRTVLQNFRIQTDAAADEKSYFRGIAHTPKLRRPRNTEPPNVAHRVDPADQTIARTTARNPLQCRRRHRRELGGPRRLLLRAASRHEGAHPRICARAHESSDLRGANGHGRRQDANPM